MWLLEVILAVPVQGTSLDNDNEYVDRAQLDPLPFHERQQAFGSVARVDRHVLSQPQHAELIDPGVVARPGAPRVRHALKLGQRLRIERPPFRAVLSGRRRPVQRPLALAAVEAREVAAPERGPVDALAIDVATAWRKPGDRLAPLVEPQFVQLSPGGLRRALPPRPGAGRAPGAPERPPNPPPP